MADTIKFRRGSNITASTTEKPKYGEPVYDATNGKLFIGTDASENTSVSTLNGDNKFFWRWDKLSVDEDHLDSNAVTRNKIQDGEVVQGKLATDAVVTNNIKNLQVTTDKLAADCVTSAKMDITEPSYANKPNNVTEIDYYVDQRAKTAAGEGVNVESAKKLATASGNTAVGSAIKPVYFSGGVPVACTTYGGGTKVTLNTTTPTTGGNSITIFAPTSAGSSGSYLKSSGSGAPAWQIAYPPTTKGTNGQLWASKGSNSSPAWLNQDDVIAGKAKQIKIGNYYYEATFSNGVLQFSAGSG